MKFLFFLFIFFYCGVNAQELTFTKVSNTTYPIIKEDLWQIISQKKYDALISYLQKKPSEVNTLVKVDSYSYEIKSIAKIPLLHYAIQQILEKRQDEKLLEILLQFNPDMQVEYKEQTPVFKILFEIATHKIQDAVQAEKLLLMILDKQPNLIKTNNKNGYTLLSYLLRVNYEYLNGKYQADYLSPDLIKILIEKGAESSTYDQSGNNLLVFCSQTNNKELEDFILNKKEINLNDKNEEGRDAMYFAIQKNSLETVQKLVENNYNLLPSNLFKQQILFKQKSDLSNYLVEKLIFHIDSYNELFSFIKVFPIYKEEIFGNSFFEKVYIPTTEIPSLLNALASLPDHNLNTEQSLTINKLQKKYMNSFSDLPNVFSAFNNLGISQVIYNSNYYYYEESTDKLLSVLKNDNLLNPETKQRLIAEVTTTSKNHVQRELKNGGGNLVILLKNYPSERNEIEKLAVQKLLSINQEVLSSNDSTGRINSQITDLNYFIDNCNWYLSNFSYKSDVVKNNIAKAQSIISADRRYYSIANSREDEENEREAIRNKQKMATYYTLYAGDDYQANVTVEEDSGIYIAVVDGGIFSSNVDTEKYYNTTIYNSNGKTIASFDDPFEDNDPFKMPTIYSHDLPVTVEVNYVISSKRKTVKLVIKHQGNYTLNIH